MKRLLSLLILPFAMAAECGSDGPNEPNIEAVVGSWTLVSFNNDPLPAPWTDNGVTRTMTAGSATINANGTFSYSETVTDLGTDQTSGTWTAAAAANTYTFIPNATPGEEQSRGTGVVSGRTMILTIEGSTDVRLLEKN